MSQYAETSKKTTGVQAGILRKEADLDLAKLNLSYTVLTAPYDGYMGRRTLEPGQYVQTGQTISYLVRNKDKWITANYKETQIANIYIGQQVRVKVDALPGKIFNGEVTAISEATGVEIFSGSHRQFRGKLCKSTTAYPGTDRTGEYLFRRNGTIKSGYDG